MTYRETFELNAAASVVFDALTDAPTLSRWLAEHVEVEPHKGGVFRFWGRDVLWCGAEGESEGEILPGLRLLPTPGHSPGHQSVLVEGGGLRALVGAQAAYTLEEWSEGADAVLNAGDGLGDRYVASLEGLRGLGAGALYLSHDSRTGP